MVTPGRSYRVNSSDTLRNGNIHSNSWSFANETHDLANNHLKAITIASNSDSVFSFIHWWFPLRCRKILCRNLLTIELPGRLAIRCAKLHRNKAKKSIFISIIVQRANVKNRITVAKVTQMAQSHVLVFIIFRLQNGISFGITAFTNRILTCVQPFFNMSSVNAISYKHVVDFRSPNCCDVKCHIHNQYYAHHTEYFTTAYHSRFRLQWEWFWICAVRYEIFEILTMSKFNHETSFIVELKCSRQEHRTSLSILDIFGKIFRNNHIAPLNCSCCAHTHHTLTNINTLSEETTCSSRRENTQDIKILNYK